MIDKNILNQAISLSLKGDSEKAEEIYLSLEKENPEDEILVSAMGLFYAQQGKHDRACFYLEKAVKKHKTAGNLSALGFCEFERSNYSNASKYLEEALQYGENEEIYDKLVSSLFEQHLYQPAIKYSKIMYEKYPDNEKSVAHIVKALTNEGKLQDAESICVDYLKNNLNSGLLWIHLGFLKELIYGDDVQACECYKKAWSLGFLIAMYHIAASFQKQGKYQEAEQAYKKYLSIFPESIDAKGSYGTCLLAHKQFEEGSKYFFERDKSYYNDFAQNRWQPGMGFDDSINVICDQGFGDNIQFIRYLPFLKEKSKNITVGVRNSLKVLFEKNYPDIKFVKYKELNPSLQTVFVTDLAYALNIDFDHIPFSAGYLKSGMQNIKSGKLKVGLCWEAGGAGIRTMINRTINIKLFEEILNNENVQFYSFQVEDSLGGNLKYPQMINLAKDFKTFEDTAAAVNAMDLIITVDTVLVHLAGALGKKTFLLLPYAADWRWFNDTKTTPWYDSVEIFKQIDAVSWEKPLKEIACALKEYSL